MISVKRRGFKALPEAGVRLRCGFDLRATPCGKEAVEGLFYLERVLQVNRHRELFLLVGSHVCGCGVWERHKPQAASRCIERLSGRS